MSSIKYHRLNQRGIGSLLFTLIMIVIISLIVLGLLSWRVVINGKR